MKTEILFLWAGCLMSIALSVFRLVWVATSLERLLMLALALLTATSLRRR
ncbi:MAG: hypothetical protein VB071_05385 [Lawsonibacter sp.]|nr:hypothetical protein [Lawsonibacter sp.]